MTLRDFWDNWINYQITFTVNQVSQRLSPTPATSIVYLNIRVIWLVSPCLSRHASPKDTIWLQIDKCRGHDYVAIITGKSLVKPGKEGDLKRVLLHLLAQFLSLEQLSRKQSGQWDRLHPCFRSSLRASPLVSTCCMRPSAPHQAIICFISLLLDSK